MAIEPYRSQIAVVPQRDAINPRFEQIRDAGEQIGQLGTSLLRAVEPHAQREADEQAIEMAARVEFGRDENGRYIRLDEPTGGARFMETYHRVIRRRHLNAIQSEAEQAMNDLSNQFTRGDIDFPTFDAQIAARLEASVLAAPDDIRGEVEETLTREYAERRRGIGHAAAARDYQVQVGGMQEIIQRLDETAADRFQAAINGQMTLAEAQAAAAPMYAQADEARRELIRLHALHPRAADAQVFARTGDIMQVEEAIGSRTRMQTVMSGLAGLSEQDQTTAGYWLAGVRTEGTVNGQTYEQFEEATRGIGIDDRRRAAAFVGGEANRQRTERLAQEAEARREAAEGRRHAELVAGIAQTTQGLYNFTQAQLGPITARWREQFGTTPIVQVLQTPEGRRMVAGFARQFGQLPEDAVAFMDNYVLTEGLPGVASLATTIRNMRTEHGAARGHIMIRQLSPTTRAALGMYSRLRASGVEDGAIRSRIEAVLRGTNEDIRVVQGRFVDQAGRGNYDQVRATAIRQALGLGDNAYLPTVLLRQFDEDIGPNMLASEGDPARAARNTAANMTAGWTRNAYFMGGVGPAHMADPRLTNGTLDRLLRAEFPRAVGASLSATQGYRFRLEPVEYGPNNTWGSYNVHLLRPDGSILATRQALDMDRLLQQLPPPDVAARRRAVDAARGRAQAAQQSQRSRPAPLVQGME